MAKILEEREIGPAELGEYILNILKKGKKMTFYEIAQALYARSPRNGKITANADEVGEGLKALKASREIPELIIDFAKEEAVFASQVSI